MAETKRLSEYAEQDRIVKQNEAEQKLITEKLE